MLDWIIQFTEIVANANKNKVHLMQLVNSNLSQSNAGIWFFVLDSQGITKTIKHHLENSPESG